LREQSGGAFFDVDRTLLPGVSAEILLVRALLRGTIPGRFRLFPFLLEGLRLIPQGLTVARKANKAYLRGATPEEVIAWGKLLFETQISPRIGQRPRDWVQRERNRGRAIVLLSGMPEPLLRPFVEYFAADLVLGTPLELDAGGRFTGRRAGPHPYGRAKRALAEEIAKERDWRAEDCSAYGDHATDSYLLEWVGEAYAVDPDSRLRRIAQQRGWTILSNQDDPSLRA
jgi:putative phosphoserine phosphatase/1-acylglycerol-3-phosphate O-acyltransferase